jgi:hypothetical protein
MFRTVIEGQDVHVVEKVVPKERVLGLHEQRADAEMTGPQGTSHDPVIQQ